MNRLVLLSRLKDARHLLRSGRAYNHDTDLDNGLDILSSVILSVEEECKDQNELVDNFKNFLNETQGCFILGSGTCGSGITALIDGELLAVVFVSSKTDLLTIEQAEYLSRVEDAGGVAWKLSQSTIDKAKDSILFGINNSRSIEEGAKFITLDGYTLIDDLKDWKTVDGEVIWQF